jgi:hypothetical protein
VRNSQLLQFRSYDRRLDDEISRILELVLFFAGIMR